MMFAETHEDYDVFWERDGATIKFAIVGHEVGRPRGSDTITLSGSYACD